MFNPTGALVFFFFLTLPETQFDALNRDRLPVGNSFTACLHVSI